MLTFPPKFRNSKSCLLDAYIYIYRPNLELLEYYFLPSSLFISLITRGMRALASLSMNLQRMELKDVFLWYEKEEGKVKRKETKEKGESKKMSWNRFHNKKHRCTSGFSPLVESNMVKDKKVGLCAISYNPRISYVLRIIL